MTQYFTTEEAAALLKLSPGTLRNWLSSGRIKCHRIGRAVRFSESDIANIADLGPGKSKTKKPKRNGKRGPRAGKDPHIDGIMQRVFAVPGEAVA
ncbi:MAG: hypothetical protein FD164_934 [Nitrospirae bacterium]|nr:MAG: hypothetical protein FD164_934 [Nitrospirota bacterium]